MTIRVRFEYVLSLRPNYLSNPSQKSDNFYNNDGTIQMKTDTEIKCEGIQALIVNLGDKKGKVFKVLSRQDVY